MIDFIKYEGLGNDFILVDDRDEHLDLAAPTVAQICHRHFGIGADGLIVVRRCHSADARMIFYNPDGTQAEMCGNGIRAFAKYLHDAAVVTDERMRVRTGAGIKTVDVTVTGGAVTAARVDMGVPSFASADIPASIPTVEAVNVPLDVDGEVVTVTCLSMGNPHCVVFVEDVATAPVDQLGPRLEHHEAFPERANVEFAHPDSSAHLSLRVWERGVGETLACGTGACAAAVAAARTGRTERKVEVGVPGGTLSVSWEGDDRVLMSGPVREVFRGALDLANFAAHS